MGHSCRRKEYRKLSALLELKGFKIRDVNPDWYKPLSTQIFPVPKNSMVFGFSVGAVLAYLIVKKYPCKKLILASISPIHTFKFRSEVKFLSKYMKKELAVPIAKDTKKIKIDLEKIKTPYVTFKGKLERGITGQVEILRTGHRLTKTYIKCIADLL